LSQVVHGVVNGAVYKATNRAVNMIDLNAASSGGVVYWSINWTVYDAVSRAVYDAVTQGVSK